MSKTTDKLKKGELYKAFEKYNTQIQAILFLDPLDSKESYHKIDEALEVLHRRMEELIKQKPGVTKEWIEEKAQEVMFIVDDETTTWSRKVLNVRNFIRSLVENISAKKATVTEEFVEKWTDKFDGFAQQGLIIDIGLLKQMLKEAEVRVKGKK